MPFRLTLQRHDGRLRSFDLSGELTTIGRGPRADVRVPLPAVDRQHCTISRRPDGAIVLTDGGSALGTLHNGTPIESCVVLQAGDVIEIGPVRFEVTPAPSLAPDAPLIEITRRSPVPPLRTSSTDHQDLPGTGDDARAATT